MFRDITIGQYYPADSILHRLDPRVKLLGVLVYIAGIFIINNIWGMLIIAVAMISLVYMSKVPVGYIMRGMKAMLYLIIIAVFFNLFFTDGNVLWSWWILRISEEGILRSVFFALRLFFVVIGSSLLTYTTTPTNLTSGLESAFSVLKPIHFPGHEIAMMMSIALRFIPILIEEVNKIIKAQLARGADFDTGGIIKKTKGMIPILIPLFVSSFRRASDLATAMESRCYNGGDNRTKLHPLKYEKRDVCGYIVQAVYLGVLIAARILMNSFLTWGGI